MLTTHFEERFSDWFDQGAVALLPRLCGRSEQFTDAGAPFEEYEPSDGGQRPVEEYQLMRAALARAHSER